MRLSMAEEVKKKPSKNLLKLKKDKKIMKYLWVPEILARMLIGRLPTSAQVEFDDIYQAGVEELIKQINRIYSDDTLIARLWDDKKKDLTVGPFFLKDLKSPYITKRDTGSMKYIKGRMLDVVRDLDPAPQHIRAQLKKINKFITQYYNTLGKRPRAKVIKEKFNLNDKQYDEIMSFDTSGW